MQHCGMKATLQITKRGSVTLPPAMRKKYGLDRVDNLLLQAEEREGGIFLRVMKTVKATPAEPKRDLIAIARARVGMTPAQRKKWADEVNRSCTPEVVRQTLKINHGDA
jgi:bifunctional DNA-binding transcriptional regulator/antitoxin component of YhaV-PrlF toxin-antitoxin module